MVNDSALRSGSAPPSPTKPSNPHEPPLTPPPILSNETPPVSSAKGTRRNSIAISNIISKFEVNNNTGSTPKTTGTVKSTVMASPESTGRGIGAPRPSGGGGVKNLLAMFEKGSSVPNSPSTPPISRQLSPQPNPLGKIRTSFVAIAGKEGVGLQKIEDIEAAKAQEALAGEASTATKVSTPVGDVTLAAPFVPTPTIIADSTPKSPIKPTIPAEPAKIDPPTPVEPEPEPQPEPEPEVKPESKPVAKPEPAPKSAPTTRAPTRTATRAEKKPVEDKRSKTPKPVREVTKVAPKPKAPVEKTKTVTEPVKKVVRPKKTPEALIVPPSRASNHARKPSDSSDKRSVRTLPASPIKPTHSATTTRPRKGTVTAPVKVPVKPAPRAATQAQDSRLTKPTASWAAKTGAEIPVAQPAEIKRSPSVAHQRSQPRLRRQKSTISDHGSRPGTSASNCHPTPSMPSSDFLARLTRPTESSIRKAQGPFTATVRTTSAMGKHLWDEPPASPTRKKFQPPSPASPKRTPKSGLRENMFSSPRQIGRVVMGQGLSELQDPEPILEEEEEERKERFKELVGQQLDLNGRPSTASASESEFGGETVIEGEEDQEQEHGTHRLQKPMEEEDDGRHTPTTASSQATLVHEGEELQQIKDD
ncbi:hypothetical protein BZA77DRAFT_343190 [Pyronema omphalodes]|nr:hypothetical protein BZA77DRAFT_343190 [Pyronema omphalodes]